MDPFNIFSILISTNSEHINIHILNNLQIMIYLQGAKYLGMDFLAFCFILDQTD